VDTATAMVANPLLRKTYGRMAQGRDALTCEIGRLYSPALFSKNPFRPPFVTSA